MSPLVVGTLNLRYDGGWRDTVPVGQKGDGSDRTHPSAGDGYGEKVSPMDLLFTLLFH